jgi:hypothetical protein
MGAMPHSFANCMAVFVQRIPRCQMTVSQACDTLGNCRRRCFVARSIGIFDRATPQNPAGRGSMQSAANHANGRIVPQCVGGELVACRIRIKCGVRHGPPRCAVAKIAVQQEIEGTWHSHCVRRLTSECVAAWFLKHGEAAAGARRQTLTS